MLPRRIAVNIQPGFGKPGKPGPKGPKGPPGPQGPTGGATLFPYVKRPEAKILSSAVTAGGYNFYYVYSPRTYICVPFTPMYTSTINQIGAYIAYPSFFYPTYLYIVVYNAHPSTYYPHTLLATLMPQTEISSMSGKVASPTTFTFHANTMYWVTLFVALSSSDFIYFSSVSLDTAIPSLGYRIFSDSTYLTSTHGYTTIHIDSDHTEPNPLATIPLDGYVNYDNSSPIILMYE